MPYLDRYSNAQPVYIVDGTGATAGDATRPGGNVYQLASNTGLAATSGTTPVTGVQAGSYIWDAQFNGAATNTIQLQALGSDGVTWRVVATQTISAGQTAQGASMGVVLGQNSTVRLYNPNATALTGVYSSIS